MPSTPYDRLHPAIVAAALGSETTDRLARLHPQLDAAVDRRAIPVQSRVGRLVRALAKSPKGRKQARANARAVALATTLHGLAEPLTAETEGELALVLWPVTKWDLGGESPGQRVDGWLGDDPDKVAAKIIAACTLGEASPRALRFALLALLAWHRWCERPPSALAVNALGVVLGVIDAETGKAHEGALRVILQVNPREAQQLAALDVQSTITSGRNLPHAKLAVLGFDNEVRVRQVRRSRGYKILCANVLRTRQTVTTESATKAKHVPFEDGPRTPLVILFDGGKRTNTETPNGFPT